MASSTASETAGKKAAAGARGGSRGGSRGSGGSGASRRRAPRKKPLAARVGAWFLAHPVIAGVACTAFLAGVAVLIFWFTNFSGLSSSADFVYSKF